MHEDLDSLNLLIEERALNEAKILSLNLQRTLTTPELNLVGWEPRCIAWCVLSDSVLTQAFILIPITLLQRTE